MSNINMQTVEQVKIIESYNPIELETEINKFISGDDNVDMYNVELYTTVLLDDDKTNEVVLYTALIKIIKSNV